jgi:uncharacterized coiled-coil DUF342 family protein
MDNHSKPNKFQIQEETLREAKEKQKKGEKLNLFEARALFSEKATPTKSSKPQSRSNNVPRGKSFDIEGEKKRLHQNIEQLERKIEMNGLSPDQEQKALSQIEKLQTRLDELSK